MISERKLTRNQDICKPLYIIAITLSIFTTLIILFKEKRFEYKYIAFIPMSYTLLMLMFFKIFITPFYRYGPIFFIAQFFIFIRYVMTPLSMVLVKDEFLTGPSPTLYDMNVSIILMVYELVAVYIAIYISLSRKSNSKELLNNISYSIFKNKLVIVLVVISLAMVLINFPNSIMPDQLLFIDDEFTNAEFDSSIAGAITILSMLFKCILFLLLLSLIKKVDKSNVFYLAIIVIVLFLFMASFTGTNRWTLIFMALTGLFITERFFPKYKKILRISTISLLVTSVISISISNFYWVVQNTETPVSDILEHMSNQFQAYFSGPWPVAQSIHIKNSFSGISVSTFFNDFLGSVPYISNYINQEDRINIYFNLYNYRDTPTLIMPLVGIGYTYFGFLLAPIFTVVAQLLIVKLDKLSQNETNLEFVFIYLYLGFRLSMSMGLSTQSLFSSMLIPTVPLLILFTINKKVTLYRKKLV